ncbi:unnamed protein product [Phytomonas sp. EM1]|nr:unnamed protein product [Phytomonas sp. EM1]|eukprot:CCW63475.1 unnamed protein product [Phytomonas sp. isolate EM1]
MMKRIRQLRVNIKSKFNLPKTLHSSEHANEGSTEFDFLNPSVDQIASPVQIARSIASFYQDVVYAYCIFDMARILDQAANEMSTEILRHPELLLVSPYYLIKNPRCFSYQIGEERFKVLQKILLALFSDHERLSDSLSQKALQESLSGTSLVSFFRGLALCSSVSHPLSHQAAFVFGALLAEGSISEDLSLEGEYNDRAVTLSRLLMATAQEFGSNTMLNAGITLKRQIGIDITYTISKKICLVFTKVEKRRLDWSLKGSVLSRKDFSSKKGWHFRVPS